MSDIGAPPPRRGVSEELGAFGSAVMFYTRLPCVKVAYSDERLYRSTRYLPAVGWIVGVIVAGAMWAASLVFPIPVAVLIGLSVGVLVTGFFHEDGFADVCDGFWGGRTRERALEIMKDSRVGVFAVAGLIVLFGLKITTLVALIEASGWHGFVGVVFAHVVSRWCLVTIIFSGEYARTDATSKIGSIPRKLSVGALVTATIWLLPFIGLLWMEPWWLLSVPVAFLVRVLLAAWFRRRIGGYTGDCLGFAQQVIEVVMVLCLLLAGTLS